MRASSAAFHRSWWRRRTGFIADMYGDVVRSRRFLLRGNSCGAVGGGGRQWWAGARVRSHVVVSVDRRGSDRVHGGGQQYFWCSISAKSTFAVAVASTYRSSDRFPR